METIRDIGELLHNATPDQLQLVLIILTNMLT